VTKEPLLIAVDLDGTLLTSEEVMAPKSARSLREGAHNGVHGGLALVFERLGLEPQQAMAIGDNINDLAMFAQVGVSVAMANAPNEVKEKANMVAPSNDDERVVWALRRCGVA
jgi:hydroxymethylpyrimidine pyrophosphatase-like HAD family hydrolase